MPKAKSRAHGQLAVIEEAAQHYHVPVWILVGVYGIETSFGANVSTSSAGARGPFQFIDSTAQQYHVNVDDFHSSAFGAAHLLSDLHKQYGSWDAAAQHYSGGGYGIADVRAKANSAPTAFDPKNFLPFQPPIPGLPDPFSGKGLIPGVPSTPDLGNLLQFPREIIGAARGFEALLKLITSTQFWIRVGEAVAGLTLIHMGLKNLSSEYAGTSKNVREVGELAAGYELTTRGAARQTAKKLNKSGGAGGGAKGVAKKAAKTAAKVPK